MLLTDDLQPTAAVFRDNPCNGCQYALYSAPDGQAHNPSPHVRCKWFRADVPMEHAPIADYPRRMVGVPPAACPGIGTADLF